MATHAKFSPSSSKRWMTCPGSMVLCEGLENTSSAFADEGTAAHFLAAACLSHGGNAEYYLGRSILLMENNTTRERYEQFADGPVCDDDNELSSFIIDEDMARHVQVYVEYVRDLVESTEGELFVEVQVPLDHITGEENATGTSDTVILAGDEVIVVDLKFGRGVEVSAENNSQLLMYASGALRHFGDLLGDFKNVRLAISQPRVSFMPSEWSCTVEELRMFEQEVLDCAQAGRDMLKGKKELYLEVSEEGCKFCKAKATCPKMAEFVAENIGADFDDLLTGPKPVVNTEKLSQHMACVDIIDDWCKAVRAEVEKQLLSGNAVEGWKLVQGRKGARAWSSKETAEELLKSLKLKKDQMYEFSLISPTTAEKLLGKDEKKWPKVLEIITQSEGKPSVAPVSDKRPAISVAPSADDFSAC